jgi:hypothetical protein
LLRATGWVLCIIPDPLFTHARTLARSIIPRAMRIWLSTTRPLMYDYIYLICNNIHKASSRVVPQAMIFTKRHTCTYSAHISRSYARLTPNVTYTHKCGHGTDQCHRTNTRIHHPVHTLAYSDSSHWKRSKRKSNTHMVYIHSRSAKDTLRSHLHTIANSNRRSNSELV